MPVDVGTDCSVSQASSCQELNLQRMWKTLVATDITQVGHEGASASAL